MYKVIYHRITDEFSLEEWLNRQTKKGLELVCGSDGYWVFRQIVATSMFADALLELSDERRD